MPLYGDPDHCAKMLRATETWNLGPDITDRLVAIQEAISPLLEHECGRTWGEDAADTSRLHWVGRYGTLLLDVPARSITSITTGGTVSGSTMTGGDATLAADLVNRYLSTDDGLVYGITLGSTPYADQWPASSYYAGWAQLPVLVTADYADSDDDDEVPGDVTYAANFLIVETFKKEMASPAGFIGPEGVVPIRDPWSDPIVKKVIKKYSLRKAWAV